MVCGGDDRTRLFPCDRHRRRHSQSAIERWLFRALFPNPGSWFAGVVINPLYRWRHPLSEGYGNVSIFPSRFFNKSSCTETRYQQVWKRDVAEERDRALDSCIATRNQKGMETPSGRSVAGHARQLLRRRPAPGPECRAYGSGLMRTAVTMVTCTPRQQMYTQCTPRVVAIKTAGMARNRQILSVQVLKTYLLVLMYTRSGGHSTSSRLPLLMPGGSLLRKMAYLSEGKRRQCLRSMPPRRIFLP